MNKLVLRLYNTLSQKKEKFVPINENRITMYVCGPTVYNYAHIGNARPAIVFDVLYRLLQLIYPDKVDYARNITDIDDKIIERAKKEKVSHLEISRRFTKAFHEDLAHLNCLSPNFEPKVTDHLPQIYQLIGELLAKKNAYQCEKHVFFNVTSFSSYGKLSHRCVEEGLPDEDKNQYKKNKYDFVLWKPSIPGTPGWQSPWGYGRPGWHIECSAMIRSHFGETIDIHGGGLDLIFPHNENERAQSMCANDGIKELAQFWIHNGFINFSGSKMSKSAGNVIYLRDLIKKVSPQIIRWAILSLHYRSPLNWSDKIFRQAQANLDRYYECLQRIEHINIDDENILRTKNQANQSASKKIPAKVFQAMLDDLNTPQAIREFLFLISEINKETDKKKMQFKKIQLLSCAQLFGLRQIDPKEWFQKKRFIDDRQEYQENLVPTRRQISEEKIVDLIEMRSQLRSKKKYREADKIRIELENQGILLKDKKTKKNKTEWQRI